MLDRMKDGIRDLEYLELKELQKELTSGSQNLVKAVRGKIKEYEQDTGCICTVCSSVIDSSKSLTFTLIFGPRNLKKKASFCAVDCLQYFVLRLKEINKKEVKQDELH
jgi:hypothetical protein